jgi:hypothetical protein
VGSDRRKKAARGCLLAQQVIPVNLEFVPRPVSQRTIATTAPKILATS